MSRPKVNGDFLDDCDGNIFALMGAFKRAAKKVGWEDADIVKVFERVHASPNYDTALSIIIDQTNYGVDNG